MSHQLIRHIVLWVAVGMIISSSVAAQENSISLSTSASTDGEANADAETKQKSDGDVDDLFRPTHDKFNLHLGIGFVMGFGDDLDDNNYENMGVQGLVGFDVVLVEPLALSFQGGFNSLIAGKNPSSVTSAFIGVGLRLRFFADTNGALSEGGTAAGNLWLDAHFDYINHIYEDHAGYNVGLGYEFALFKNINIGPYARFMHVAIGDGLKYMTVSGGLAISIAGDTQPGDMDKDGIANDVDECEREAEDKDGFNDEDGCPELDNDEDGIDDEQDECPDDAGIEEKNGCPETDNDHDGIENDMDECTEDAEDMDGFEDEDGCPDLDNDKDGVEDAADKCATKAEDKDGFEDEDGCPELDNDNDGINDDKDQCPNEAENKDGKEDEDGCPDLVRVTGDQIKTLQKVVFKAGKADISEQSHELLNQMATVIKAKPEMNVRIEDHTNEIGNDKRNMALSKDRADSVKKFLVTKGVEDSRLVAEGKGKTAPIADSKTKDGKEKNRRVEFHIISPESKKETKVEKPAETEEKKADK